VLVRLGCRVCGCSFAPPPRKVPRFRSRPTLAVSSTSSAPAVPTLLLRAHFYAPKFGRRLLTPPCSAQSSCQDTALAGISKKTRPRQEIPSCDFRKPFARRDDNHGGTVGSLPFETLLHRPVRSSNLAFDTLQLSGGWR